MALPVTPLAVYFVVLLWTTFPFVPPEPLLVAAGSWSAAGALTAPVVVAVAAAGSLLSDVAKYGIGRLAGPALMRRVSRLRSGGRAAAWIENRLTRIGPAVLVPAYFVPLGVVVSTLLCGALRVPLRAVALASVAGSTLWSGFFVLLGFLGGAVAGNPLVGLAIALPAALLVAALVTRRAVGATGSQAPQGRRGGHATSGALQGAAAGQGPPQRQLVGELQVTAHGQP